MDVEQIIERGGGVVALSRATGIKPSTISKWKRAPRGIPIARVAAVSAATGIPRHEIRNDVWDPPASEAP